MNATSDADKAMPQVLTPDEQAVQHRISEAGSTPDLRRAGQRADRDDGDAGRRRAWCMRHRHGDGQDQSRRPKPGVPRELLPTTALARFIILNDFIVSLGKPAVTLQEALPLMIRILGAPVRGEPRGDAAVAPHPREVPARRGPQVDHAEAAEGSPEEEEQEAAAG
jgi:hypothetical protein